jgi:hypothetical protein
VAAIDAIGESPDMKLLNPRLCHWDIRNPGDNLFMHFGTATLETPMSGSQLSVY